MKVSLYYACMLVVLQYICSIQTNNKTIMTLTKEQNEELDSLKNHIESIEKNMENARVNLDIAIDVKNKTDISNMEKALDFGQRKIYKMISHQSESMKLEYNLVLDLIFDREHTLEKISE